MNFNSIMLCVRRSAVSYQSRTLLSFYTFALLFFLLSSHFSLLTSTSFAQSYDPISSIEDPTYDDNPAFDPDVLFPTWGTKDSGVDNNLELDVMDGVIGKNTDQKKLWQYIPRIIDLFIKLMAPVIVGITIYVGVRFIYAGDNTERVDESKKHFQYLTIGIIIIAIAYSLMKGVYFLLAT